jgi:aspartyl protease/tetratricopeptide repeat protein
MSRSGLRAALVTAVLLLAVAAGAIAAEEDGATAFKAARFDDAAVAYARALGENPDDITAQLGLANVALLRNRLDDAERHAEAVLNVEPSNARAQFIMGTVVQRRGKPGTFVFSAPATPLTIPFVVTDPLPLLRVRIGGRDALFFIDTGAPNIMLDPALASELHLTVKDLGSGVFAGGKHATVRTTTVAQFELGGLRIGNVPAVVLPTRQLTFWPGRGADGAIGTGLLLRFLSTIDYAHGALVLRARSGSHDFEQEADARGDTVVPMWLEGDHFIFARARINDGPEGMYNVDTGLAGGGLSATKATLDAAHVKLDESNAAVGQGGGGAVQVIPFTAAATLGDLTVQNVTGLFTPEGTPYGIFPFDVAGTISHGFFRAYALTLDFDAMRLVVTR